MAEIGEPERRRVLVPDDLPVPLREPAQPAPQPAPQKVPEPEKVP